MIPFANSIVVKLIGGRVEKGTEYSVKFRGDTYRVIDLESGLRLFKINDDKVTQKDSPLFDRLLQYYTTL